MRRPNSNKYVTVEAIKAWFYWHECDMCGVRFKFEPGYDVFTHLKLTQPTEKERESGIRWRYEYPIKQCVCDSCGKRLFGVNPFMITHQDFQDRLFRIHDGPKIEEQIHVEKTMTNAQPGLVERAAYSSK